jgi:RimJ/RimL family protein N-acetyltransferase
MSDTTLVIAPTILAGRYVRLEPLAHTHIPGLVAAAREDPALYRWSTVPQGVIEMAQYVDTALGWREEGSALPFATVRAEDDTVIGSTRFFLLERWAWPAGHPHSRRNGFDSCEIGYTWLAASASRTAANTEAKLLMLAHAFEAWGVHRVCFHTDVRNERSRAARRGAARASPGVRLEATRLSALLHRRGGVAGREAGTADASQRRCNRQVVLNVRVGSGLRTAAKPTASGEDAVTRRKVVP